MAPISRARDTMSRVRGAWLRRPRSAILGALKNLARVEVNRGDQPSADRHRLCDEAHFPRWETSTLTRVRWSRRRASRAVVVRAEERVREGRQAPRQHDHLGCPRPVGPGREAAMVPMCSIVLSGWCPVPPTSSEPSRSVWALGPCAPGPLKSPRGAGPSAGVRPAAGTPASSSVGSPGSPGRDRAPRPKWCGGGPASNGRPAEPVAFPPSLPGGTVGRAGAGLKCDYIHF